MYDVTQLVNDVHGKRRAHRTHLNFDRNGACVTFEVKGKEIQLCLHSGEEIGEDVLL